MTTIGKPIIFYSGYCEHSNEILMILTKNCIKDSFKLVSVDELGMKNIPKFVDRVPMMFYQDKILSDEDFFNYLDKVKDARKNSKNGDEQQVDIYQEVSGFSDSFSFIDSEDAKKNDTHLPFVRLENGDMFDNRIETPNDESNPKNKSNESLEDLLYKRDQDVKEIMK
jgi:hypothetical protein